MNVFDELPISVVLSSSDVLPKELFAQTRNAIGDDSKVAVSECEEGVRVHSIWHVSLDVAVHQIRNSLPFEVAASSLKVNYILEPDILEPIMRVSVFSVEEFVGDILGHLNNRRALILGMNNAGTELQVTCNIPLVELLELPYDLQKLTNGRARIDAQFQGYERAPNPNPPTNEPTSAAMRA